ncbi:hypothetical protein HOY80DRAFT_998776 [Tuber brumale]|nr:hypothetical protein HOY80DRAFT_998776 [Tuber brumale]
MDVTIFGSPEENVSNMLNPVDTLRMKGCINGYCLFTPRMEKRMIDIKLGPRPLPLYKLKPVIEPLRALFHAFFPEEYPKYKAVYGTIYDGRADNIDEVFGIWTLPSLVINVNASNHKDVEDICHGWCAIVILGDFKGDDACFPEHGVD